jgi:hypothetical protein
VVSTLTHALLVGVARYRAIADLPQAVRNDVEDLSAVLLDPERGGLDAGSVRILLDEAATASAIRMALGQIATAMQADGSLLLYFSGHGDRADDGAKERSWLLPHDFDPSDVAATALSSDEIVASLEVAGGARQVVMIDACHAGGVGSRKRIGAAPKGIGPAAIGDLAQGAGRALLTSSRADEYSAVLPGARNSVFTGALLEALDGATIDRGDDLIGVLDVFHYVADTVPTRVDGQHPVLHATDLEGNIAMARRRSDSSLANMDLNVLARLFSDLYPTGPLHDGIWARSGGKVSQLNLSGNGLAQWHAALTRISFGGDPTLKRVAAAALEDYPDEPTLRILAG